MRSVIVAVTGAVAAVAALLAVLLLPGAVGTDPADRADGVVLDAADRSALALPGAELGPAPDPGAEPLPRDPHVDPADAAAVATAYLVVAHAAVPADAGRTQRRAAAWAEPGGVPATVGVLVLDAPPPGSVRSARVDALELAAADPRDVRRLYRAVVVTTTGPPGAPPVETGSRVDVVLARQSDGHWLVRAESPAAEAQPGDED